MDHMLLNDNDEAIMKEALAPILAQFLQPPLHDLYHYTTGDGLLGIVKDQKLLATHISCLNDTSELVYAIEKFKDKLEKRLKEPLPDKIKHLLQSLKQIIDGNKIETSPVFVACFSSVDDDLNQWRTYGGGEGGYSIRLDGSKLRAKEGSIAVLVKVWYDENEHDRIFTEILVATENAFASLSKFENSENIDELITEFFSKWLDNLYFLAPCIKHPKFAAEQEWRYVAYLSSSRNIERRFVQKQSMLVRQIFLKWCDKLPITGVTVGPCRHVPQSVIAVADYMQMHDYIVGEGFVTRTAVPYRQT